jgi:misacylated tRNA(Ala) deacylase
MAASVLLLSPTTPPDYHRIVSETLAIPTNQQQTIPVGLLACQRMHLDFSCCFCPLVRIKLITIILGDPLLRELSTVIISAQAHVPVKTAAPAKRSKSSATGTVPIADKLLEVVTHDTVIFPEGGGQPSDIGTLLDPHGTEYEVVYVRRVGGHAVHFIKVDDIDKTLQVLTSGAQVKLALGKNGLDRRIDHVCTISLSS